MFHFHYIQIKLENIVSCTDGVEIWLGRLLEEMINTIQCILAKIASELLDPEFDFVKDFQEYCGQVRKPSERIDY